ncbi:hypothetical protein QFC19_003284 [Naganishia cerealis]|uniref:Uncharacterized protein n=1 Tax=Naganishia cerealis TaxID=610337 RepID=A0ACC2W3R3_9TREE|nr:hypothetical protein QFC19_003284 [Naganishia cerealis]
MDKRLILVAPSPASCDNKSDPLSGMGSNSLLGLLRSLQHQAFFEGIRLSLVYSNDYTRQLGMEQWQSGTIQAIVQALTVDQPLTLETNGKIFLSDGRVISSTDTTMAGVLAYSKLGNRLVGLNALKSGIQSTFRKSIRFLDNSGIHKRHIQTGFTALASVAGLWLAWKSWFPSIVYVLFGFAFWRSLSSTKGKSTRKARNKSMNETCSTAVFLGSGKSPSQSIGFFRPNNVVSFLGGHTGEAIQLLSTLDPDRYTPRKYIFCTGDSMSLNKATVFEKDLRSRSTKGGTAGESHTPVKEPFQFIELPRARKVGQSYISSIGTTIYSLTITVWELTAKPIFTRQSGEIPDLLIVNGPGTCVVVVLAYKLLRMLGQPSPEVIYVESFARVTSLSLSGKILKNVVDRFIVQWPIETDAKPSGVEFSAANGKESHSNVEHHGWLI